MIWKPGTGSSPNWSPSSSAPTWTTLRWKNWATSRPLRREKKARHLRLAGPGKTEPPINVKLSPGGIREVEFFTQALTLTFGGRLRHLRQSRTLEGLVALAEEGLISADDRESLSRAYIFLRTVEHRLQMREMSQTQMLPRDPAARTVLARSLGFVENPLVEFRSTLDVHMAQVKQRFGHLLAEPGDKDDEEGDSEGPPAWVTRLLDVLDQEQPPPGRAGRKPGSGGRSGLACLPGYPGPEVPARPPGPLRRAPGAAAPGLHFFGRRGFGPGPGHFALERFLTSVGPRAGFFILLQENPELINLLSVLFGSGGLPLGDSHQPPGHPGQPGRPAQCRGNQVPGQPAADLVP